MKIEITEEEFKELLFILTEFTRKLDSPVEKHLPLFIKILNYSLENEKLKKCPD